MPLIQYEDYCPSREQIELIVGANKLIEDYAAQGLSLTLRQLYYRFVASGVLPNTQKDYRRLGYLVNRARLGGLMDWGAIEDRGRNLMSPSLWKTPGDIIESAARSFRLDKWADQAKRVEVWVEKQALESVVGQAADQFDVPYFACKGYTSQSEMWRAAQRFSNYASDGQESVVIYLGDHDPSGVDMSRDIFDRLNSTFGVDVEVDRIALTMEQVTEHDPPPNPAKVTDSRAAAYIARFGPDSWELDALEPATLNGLIQDAIRGNLNDLLWEAQVEAEDEAREGLVAASQHWGAIEQFLREPL